MHFLISNDDGYLAPGIRLLAERLRDRGRVSVVAPERDRSGASNSLTLDNPIRVRTADNGFLFVDGTPTDCVHLAITGLLEDEPDIVVSGINSGANLGDDVHYSGTVAAAMEGRFLGFPAIAVSLALAGRSEYATAASVVERLLDNLASHQLPRDTILNVNVPDVPLSELRGVQVTRLGNRHKAEPMVRSTDPRGRTVYWVGPPEAAQDSGPGTDFHAVHNGYASVTPLQVDLTRHESLATMRRWLAGLEQL